jgi:acetyl esterase/lipase
MATISSKNLAVFLGLLNFKTKVEKSFHNPVRTKKQLVSAKLFKKFDVSEFKIMEKSVITIQPKTNVSDFHILFFHGGAYLIEGSAMHWKIVENIASNAHCRVSYIDYPLAPEHNYRFTFDMVQQSYDKLTNDYPHDRFMLMGDSAGGGLALAFAQKLVNENAAILPEKNILFSPWLDLSMQNPAIRKQEHLDKILPYNGLVYAGKQYAADHDVNHFLLSPINGEMMDRIGKTLVFYGTDELFYPDCLRLKEKTSGLANFSFREFQGMQHDWVIFPIHEAKEALEMAVEFINE